MKEAIVLMAKEPVPGCVKTRLAPELSPEDAARLYACMLWDTAEEIVAVERTSRYLFLDPPEAAHRVRGDPFPGFGRFPQRGRDLGARMENAAAVAFRRGAVRVVIVGGDCPALGAARIRAAFRELRDGARVVFGPSVDGGYYLVGLSPHGPRLFRRGRWGTAWVLADAAACCRSSEAPFSFLTPERDVDTFADLLALRAWAGGHRTPECPRTRAFLSGFFASARGATPGPRARTPAPLRGPRSPRAR